MGIRCIKDESNIEHILKNLKVLSEKKMEIGIRSGQNEKLLMIANANEFGAHITPKNGKYLSIPLEPKYKHVSPRNVQGLFVFKSNKGNLFLVKSKGKRKKELEFCYWLTKEIDIPERSFIRAGFDAHKKDFEDFGENLLSQVITQKDGIQRFYEAMGEYVTGLIKAYLVDLRDPASSPLTIKLKTRNSTNPLVDTGRLRDAITYKIRKR